MKVLITGASGFIGKNLKVHLTELKDIEVFTFTREQSLSDLPDLINNMDFVFHLAGVNRPETVDQFKTGNIDLTLAICDAIEASDNKIPMIFSSSIQATKDNPYGHSKLAAEQELLKFSEKNGSPVYIFRLPNVFGKWCKPNYNSVVATFCNNMVNDIPIEIHDRSTKLKLVYIDDVIRQLISVLHAPKNKDAYCHIDPVYEISLGKLADKISSYKNSRDTLITEKVGVGIDRALHSTYLSYIQPNNFSYPLVKHGDQRGVFVEMLKTKDSGQISFFTAHPGITRGGHYHHSKTEKFLVIKGEALFKFKNILNNESYELKTTGNDPEIVETVPGWTHDITNTGNEEMLVMLWANEIFDKDLPDTYACPL
ncbi:MAG: SDR family oxidoreductase [Bdellovibrionaceae bacterium]|jgi:UDP-2-acetamido-2,6-beta-L-arabino-hexul-4-ose reductase|nr:SDR family oxidoreductase [Pseudobdellovibrionaceae bacterium]